MVLIILHMDTIKYLSNYKMEQIIKENKNWGLLSKSKLYLRVKDLGISKTSPTVDNPLAHHVH